MRHSKCKRILCMLLSALMVLGFSATAALAYNSESETRDVSRGEENCTKGDAQASFYDSPTFGTNGYYNVISKKNYDLVPGAATETEMVLNNAEGTRRQVIHVIEVDPSNPDVSIIPGYYNIDKDLSDVNNQKASKLTDMAAYYEDTLGYNIIGGMNTDLYYAANAPHVLVYNGQDLRGPGGTTSVLCVYKNSEDVVSCSVKPYNKAEMDAELENGNAEKGQLLQAVSVSFGMVVNDGELVSKTEERTSAAAARSMVGVKEDGTLVICMNDGRGANNSVGFCNYEEGEAMLALGCRWAANCDGGGSSTFISKRAGETEFAMRSVPCDGAERATIHGVFVTSNVAPTGILGNVNIKSAYDYFAPGTEYSFEVEAIDTHGYAMEMPADVVWQLSSSEIGTLNAGVFKSNGTLGDTEIQITIGGEVKGSKAIHVANPESLTLSQASAVLPYSTPEKPRMITLPIIARIGEASVYFDESVFTTTLSVENGGTLNGFDFTAPTAESGVTAVDITATYTPTQQQLTYHVDFGQGSELIFDFEDGNVSDWVSSFDGVDAWLTEHGVQKADQLFNLIDRGQICFDTTAEPFLSTKENGGQVHNGSKALGVEFDMKNSNFNTWTYLLLFNVGEPVVLRDIANGKNATSFGMWCYIPEGFCNPPEDTAGALSMQKTSYVIDKPTTEVPNPQLRCTEINFTFYSEHQQKKVMLNQCTNADIPESRWVYMSIDLTPYDYVSFQNPTGTIGREPAFLRMYIKPTRAQKITFYFDNFTLDYSSAVDDRDAPVISNAVYCVSDTNIPIDGQTIDTGVVSFNADIADYAASNAEGLDYASAAVYVDEVRLSGVEASGTGMSVENVNLSDGKHSIRFEIADRLGNISVLTKTLTVNTGSEKAKVFLAGHNDLNNTPEYDSVYYVDIKASDISQIESVASMLSLNTANTWELEHMIAAEGYSASYTYNDISKLAVVTVTRTGECTLAGEQILVSIPVRVWSYDETTYINRKIIEDEIVYQTQTATERFNNCGEPIVLIDVEALSILTAYTNASTASCVDSISVATKITGNKVNGMWHLHTDPITLEDKVPTCTEPGYIGRTYCNECGSVVDWGTTVPATGHHYEIVNGQFVCSDCGEVYQPGTGLFEMNGKKYYAINNQLVTGWQKVDEVWYYFGDNCAAYTGEHTVSDRLYDFGETGAITHGQWFDIGGHRYYYFGPSYEHAGGTATIHLCEIDGNTYGFNRQGHMIVGLFVGLEGYGALHELYYFNTDGVKTDDFTCSDGILKFESDIFYVKDKKLIYAGLVCDHDDGNAYYYVTSGHKAVKNGTFYVNKNNELLPKGYYQFGADGKMILQNGIIGDYYYVDGVPTYAGLLLIDGSYYYADTSGYIVKNGTFYVNKNNNLLSKGYYQFGADGKMILQNGIIGDYYYVDGVPTYAGLLLIDGSYYYAGTSGYIVKNGTFYVNKNNNLMPKGYYQFGADGKMILQNGIIGDYYYVDGVPTYAGLLLIDGSYYYAGTSGYIVKNGTFYVNKNNNLMPKGYYQFDAEGKMILP